MVQKNLKKIVQIIFFLKKISLHQSVRLQENVGMKCADGVRVVANDSSQCHFPDLIELAWKKQNSFHA